MIGAATPLSGRHALVTGAGSGIGAGVVEALAELGAAVTLLGRDRTRLERTAARLAPTVRRQIRPADVTDFAAVERAFAEAAAGFGPIDVLINGAGAARTAKLAETDPQLWRAMLAVNLDGVYACCRAALPSMIARRFGRVVNVASTAGLRGSAYASAYCAAKHGVVGLTRALALETVRDGVTVNAVCPNYTETEMLERALDEVAARTGRDRALVRAAILAQTPHGRFVTVAEVVRAVVGLCIPGSEAVTGQAIAIEGAEAPT